MPSLRIYLVLHLSKYRNIIQGYEQSVIGVITHNLHPFYSLLRAYHIWFTPTFSGMHLGHKTRPGHCNMQHCLFISDYWSCMCVCVFLTAVYFRVTYCPTFRACGPFRHVPYVSECPWEGLGNIRHLGEWGTSSEGGAILCHVECITVSFLNFSSLGRTLSESWMALQWGGCVWGAWT